MTPVVSIIIPVYNSEQYIRECLDSIIIQSFKFWECILVNDGSTDSSGEICDEYAEIDSRFHVIHKENGGVSSARNSGLEIAKGKYISFIDSDDSISQNFFDEKDFSKDSDLIIKTVCFTTNISPEKCVGKGIVKGDLLKDFYSRYLPFFVFRTPWAKIIRREIIFEHNIRYNPAFRLGEDTLFVHACLNHVRSLIVSEYGAYQYKPFEQGKYHFPLKVSLSYMHYFAKGFFALDVKCPQLVKNMLVWYSSFSTDFTGLNKIRWYSDLYINRLYRHAISLFPYSMRIKILLYSVIAHFRS